MLSVHDTPLAGLVELVSNRRSDARGQFTRLYCAETFSSIAPGASVAQINLSHTRSRGTVRGLHWQGEPLPDGKVVRCLRGHVFDVAVDLRPDSDTYAAWYGVELHEREHRALYIPAGFAHGFQTLTDDVELLYVHTAPYAPECEGGVHHADATIGVSWPLPVSLVSARDAALPTLPATVAGAVP